MKKILFSVLLLSICFLANAQYEPKGKVSKADLALQNGKLDEAKAEIDLAFELDEKGKTLTNAKNWFIRGKVYEALYLDEGAYHDPNALDVAIESFNKVKSMEKEGSPNYGFSELELTKLYGTVLNKGAELYNENDYEGAYESFILAEKIAPNDTTALIYAGVSAQQLDKIDEALACYDKLIDNGTANIDTYKTTIYLLRVEKEDLDKVLEYTRAAADKFPDVTDFRQEEISTLINMGRTEEAENQLNTAVASDPSNPVYYYFLGYMYDEKGDTEKSIESYEKAIELNPDYYEANYNVGVVYYNLAGEIYKELNELSPSEYTKRLDEFNQRAAVEYKKALPYLEKAVDVDPGKEPDVNLLETLMGVYMRLKMKDKSDAIEARIKEIDGEL